MRERGVENDTDGGGVLSEDKVVRRVEIERVCGCGGGCH